MDKLDYVVTDEFAGERLDKYISKVNPHISRTMVKNLIDKEFILVNNKQYKSSYCIKTNDIIHITVPDPVSIETVAEKIPLSIIYEDDDLLVVNKPKGMVVHPAAGNFNGTLVNALLYHCGSSLSGINGAIRPGIVHRIDKNTSGLLIVAKNDFAHKFLSEQIKAHSFTREYEAVIFGHLKQSPITIHEPIGRNKNDRKKMCVTLDNSKDAVTHIHVIEEIPGYSHIKCILETGRTHQIRVHMSYIGHPIVGDDVYSNYKQDFGIQGQCLHAKKIGFIHPRSNQYMEFNSELPDYFIKLWNQLKK